MYDLQIPNYIADNGSILGGGGGGQCPLAPLKSWIILDSSQPVGNTFKCGNIHYGNLQLKYNYCITSSIRLGSYVEWEIFAGVNFCMIDQYTLKINFRIFLIVYACSGRLRACIAGSSRTFVRYTVTLASLASLIVAGLIDTDSGPLGSERSLHFDALEKNRSRESFSKLALHLAPAASDSV